MWPDHSSRKSPPRPVRRTTEEGAMATDEWRNGAGSASRRGDSSPSDVIERLRIGDEAAWTDVVRSHESRLRAVGRAHRLGGQEVEDALQRTWVSLLTHARQIRDPRCLPAWLTTTMRNECLRELRGPGRLRDQLVGDWDPYEARCADDDVCDVLPDLLHRRELAARIWDHVDALPPRQRDLVRALYGEEEVSYADVSARTGMPVGAIGPTRQRALSRLRELIGTQDGSEDGTALLSA
ncbi:RNA polymerase sigma factor [Geodermatophilus sp. SYSU D00965]